MKIKKIQIFMLPVILLWLASTGHINAQNSSKRPVIVEVFTAEGCAACPAAEKYFEELLARQPLAGTEIIGLAEHVDYWNQLGWVDRFANAQFSNRQKYYAAFFNRREIFTPQLIVDGTREIKLKDKDKILDGTVQAVPKGKIDLKILSQLNNIGKLQIKITELPAIPAKDRAAIVIGLTEDDLDSNVAAGENAGRRLQHRAVVRFLKTVAEVTDSSEKNLSVEIPLSAEWQLNKSGIVVFVQQVESRRITAAAKINLSAI